MGRFSGDWLGEIRPSDAKPQEAPFQSARPACSVHRSIDYPGMLMVMVIRADRPASSPAKTALAIFEGDTRMYPGTGRAFRAAERHTQDIHRDGRKRQQTPSRLLLQFRHADLRLCRGQSP